MKKKDDRFRWQGLCPRSGAAALALLLGACGGGGGSGGGGTGPTDPGTAALQPSASYAQRCAAANPEAPAPRSGSLAVEKQWIRAYMDEAYLWNTEVAAVDAGAAAYSGSDVATALQRYFDALLTPQLTATGARRDRFSFMMPTREWQASAGAGEEVGYGLEWRYNENAPRNIRIAYVDAGGIAQAQQLGRGMTLLSADGVGPDAQDAAGVDTLNAALFPATAGERHAFVFRHGDGSTVSLSLVSGLVVRTPVPRAEVLTAADGAAVGHLILNDYLAPAEAPLIEAMRKFQAAGVSDLVLDLRYNGGGYVYLASELAYMIAGPARSGSQAFERVVHNARRSAENDSTPFYNTSCFLNAAGTACTNEQPLPTLNLGRVFVLAQSGTCSASEAVINGLRGIGVEVVLIGGTTCGKPYGFTARDNCGYSYFPIEFSGVNAQGFGDYSDGFTPAASGSPTSREVRGCSVADDFAHELSDPAEAMRAAALGFRTNAVCPPAAAHALSARTARDGAAAGLALAPRHPLARSGKFYGGRP